MVIERMPSLLDAYDRLPAAAPVRERLRDAGGVYLVGGAVRDLLRGHLPDLDFVVDGDLDAVIGAIGGSLIAYDRFGTATVEIERHRYDFARARRERYPHPGALPEVEPAGIVEDLGRRDFTVNAMALALGGDDAGTLFSVDHAREDLSSRQLRVLHDASFSDDPTRLLRMARYAARLLWAIEPHTLALARAAIETGALGTVSGPRLGAELRLLAAEPDPVTAFGQLREFGIDEALARRFGLADPDLARRALALLPPDGNPGTLVTAAAGLRMSGSELAALLDRLAFDARTRDAIVAAATGAKRTARAFEGAASPSDTAAAVGLGAEPELVALAGAMGPAGPAREWLDSLRHVRLQIDGHDLLAAGIPSGPAVGRGLAAALAAKLDGQVHDRETELAVALGAARGSG
jgi:tRNA nucleotidyltransferase (CCA-adding enzyme)